MTLLFANIVLDIAQIFLILVFVLLCNLSIVDPSSWMASSIVFIITLVFFESLSMGLRLICISKRGIIGLSLVFILILPSSFVFVFLS